MIEYGKAKHFSKVKLQDHLKNFIWTSAHDETHDEEWEKPIVGACDVTQEIIDCPVVVPIITLRVEGTDLFGTAWYLHKDRELFAIAVWHEERWNDLIYGTTLKPPAVFVSVPTILGQKDVRFIWDDPKDEKAFRIS